MNIVWDELINRQKITADNVDYLILVFEKIGRKDLVRLLKQYSTTSVSEQPLNSSSLFNRTDPKTL